MMKNIVLAFCITISILISCKSNEKHKQFHKENKGIEIELTTIFTNDLDKMKLFFNEKMGLSIIDENPEFVEFRTSGSRFSIGLRNFMFKTLKDSTYLGNRKGAAVGIGFNFSSKEEVDSLYKKMSNNDVLFLQKPKLMSWNEYTAFFKDPDGNVHELIYKEK
ncbi:VOC family protein [Tenacibaculum amylolyticum]|uniref:VOC family protein n=1 Tax=Tenacibaculum amylolyticum TaxID=104269 RepID=UPI0038B517F8